MKLRQLTGKIKLRPEGETQDYCERRTDNVLAMYKSVSSKRGARDIYSCDLHCAAYILCQHLGVHIDIRLERDKGGVELEGFPHLE